MLVIGRNTAMVTMVRISNVKNSKILWKSVMVIMVKISNVKMLVEGRNTAMVTLVRVSNKKSRQIKVYFILKSCDFCDFGVCGVTRKVASLGFDHLFVHLVM